MSERWTVQRMLEWSVPFFKQRGIESARLDAELLLAHALKLSRLQLYTGFDRPLVESELAAYKALVKRRAQHEPIAYITGSKGFHALDLVVDKRVLIPRPETELLVDLGAPLLAAGDTFADIGTGSGAVALALLTAKPGTSAIAIDLSPDALAVAKLNADKLGLSDRVALRQGSLCEPLREQLPLIVSNPPYVETTAKLDPDVAEHEPHLALFAGPSGLDLIRPLLAQAKERLTPGGTLLMEFGLGQGKDICAIAAACGYTGVALHRDLNGIERVLEAKR